MPCAVANATENISHGLQPLASRATVCACEHILLCVHACVCVCVVAVWRCLMACAVPNASEHISYGLSGHVYCVNKGPHAPPGTAALWALVLLICQANRSTATRRCGW